MDTTADFQKPHIVLEKTIRSGNSAIEGMADLIYQCENECPGPIWNQLRKLDYASDVIHLTNWLRYTLSKERPSVRIKAYWFGIFNPIYDGKESCDLYISGSATFDPADASAEWACWADDSYLPKGKYAHSTILDQIYTLVQTGTEKVFPEKCHWRGICVGSTSCWFGEYVLCLGYACLAVNEACQGIWPPLLATAEKPQAIAVGFDSGDIIILGHMDKNGWHQTRT